MTLSYVQLVDQAVAFIKGKVAEHRGAFDNPKFGIVCGSGLGGLAKRLQDPFAIPYSQIPGFAVSTVSGHSGELVFGWLKGTLTVCMNGRFHYYEGYELKQVTLPIRVLAGLGVGTLLLTNAAGGVDPAFDIGDVMAIEDHISLPQMAGIHVLRGPNLDEYGPRFPALTRVYDADTRSLLEQAARNADLSPSFIRSGVYCVVGGPTYETPAEIRFLRTIGGSAVGMSTVPEVIVAVHSGIPRILAFSLITNRCVADAKEAIAAPTHGEVLETAKIRVEQLERIVEELSLLLFPQ